VADETKAITVITSDPAQVVSIIRANLGPGGLSAFDLDAVKVPAGGATTWQYPTASGVEDRKTFEGVLIYRRDVKAYWEHGLEESGGGSPPDCRSEDSIVGVGNPGGACAECPFNQFGSARKGKGKACKDRRLLFVLPPGQLLPVLVSVPVMSIKPSNQYLMRLAGDARVFHSVLTRFGLETAKNSGNIAYSRITFTKSADLPPEEQAKVAAYVKAITPFLAAVKARPEDFDDESGG
jgi:hypothetical protein